MKKNIKALLLAIAYFAKNANYNLKKMVLVGLLSVAAGSVLPAAAVCSWVNPGFSKGTIEYTHSYTLLAFSPSKTSAYNMSTYEKTAIDFATSMGAGSDTQTLVNCTEGETLRFDRPDPTTNTSAPGIIFRFPMYRSTCSANCLFRASSAIALDPSGDINAQFLTNNTRIGTQFARTPSLLTYVNGHVERQYVGTVRTSDGLELVDIYMGEWTFTVVPCEVGGYDKSVDLGSHDKTDFRAPGYSVDAAKFTLNMACVTGITPKMTFKGTVHPEHPDVLTNNGSATGVGLTLSYVSTPSVPITFGSPINLRTSTNSSYFSDHTFNATLYQTDPSVSGGSLDFVTTFIIEFE